MKILNILLVLCVFLIWIIGCSSQQTSKSETKSTSSASWAFDFVVYDGVAYVVTIDKVTDVEKQIGEVTSYSNVEGTYAGNFSNTFAVGTKYYEIYDIKVEKSIAIQLEDGGYVRAGSNGKYGAK